MRSREATSNEPSVAPYKERPPDETVRHVRRILDHLEIPTEVDGELDNDGVVFSISLGLAGLPYRVNGKGVSRAYARASGYAELLERLQNQVLFPYTHFDPAIARDAGFQYDPGERRLDPASILPLPEDFRAARLRSDVASAYDVWELLSGERRAAVRHTVCLPYWNVGARTVTHLPRTFVMNLVSSTGMCAGNSRDEALVQGFSEIFERYVQRRVYFDELAPPTVPRAWLATHAPRQLRLIEDIERIARCQVVVKDCSLEGRFPVVATVLLLSERTRYTVNFGAHPVWKLALERCLTEAFQGQAARGYRHATAFADRPSVPLATDFDNYARVMTTAKGQYPAALLDEASARPFTPFVPRTYVSQRAMVEYLVAAIGREGLNIFLRDVSFLGFPSYQILVPGLSETKVLTRNAWREMVTVIPVVEYVRDLNRLSPGQLSDLATDMEGFLRDQAGPAVLCFTAYLGMPVTAYAIWDAVPLQYLLAVMRHRLGDVPSACAYLAWLADALDGGASPRPARFMRASLALLREMPGVDEPGAARQLLRPSFGQELAGRVVHAFSKGASIEDAIGAFAPGFTLPTCWDCARCAGRPRCRYADLERIQRTVLRRAGETPLRQEAMADACALPVDPVSARVGDASSHPCSPAALQ